VERGFSISVLDALFLRWVEIERAQTQSIESNQMNQARTS